MYAAGQAWIEAAHRAHDVDTLEVLRAVVFEDRRVLYRIFVGTRSSIDITRVCVPRRWRIRMVVGNLTFADDDVMGKDSANCLVEAAADCFFRYLEVSPGGSAAGIQFRQCLLDKVESRCCRVRLEVSTSAIPLQRVAPLWDLPFQLGLGKHGRFRQVDFYAVPGCLHVANVDQAGKRCGPEACK